LPLPACTPGDTRPSWGMDGQGRACSPEGHVDVRDRNARMFWPGTDANAPGSDARNPFPDHIPGLA